MKISFARAAIVLLGFATTNAQAESQNRVEKPSPALAKADASSQPNTAGSSRMSGSSVSSVADDPDRPKYTFEIKPFNGKFVPVYVMAISTVLIS